MVKRNDKTNTGEGDKGKKGRTVSDDVGGKSLSDTSTSVGVKSTVIHTSVNKFEVSKRDKPQYFVDKVKDKQRTKNNYLEFLIGWTNDGLKTIILSSSSVRKTKVGQNVHTGARGRRRVTQRFPTRVIRDSPALFAFATLSRVRFVTPLHHFCTEGCNFFLGKTKKSNFFFNFQKCLHTVTGGAMGAHSIRESGLCLCV